MEFEQILPNKIACFYSDDLTAENELAGYIKRVDEYWRFYPDRDAILTCGSLKRLAKKISDLNGDVA